MDSEKIEPTEEERTKDRENSRNEFESRQVKTYRLQNRGLDIKIDIMERLYTRFKELDKKVDSQSGDEQIITLTVMAEIGKAILPD